jgi:hypothetical protein
VIGCQIGAQFSRPGMHDKWDLDVGRGGAYNSGYAVRAHKASSHEGRRKSSSCRNGKGGGVSGVLHLGRVVAGVE